MVTVTTVRRNFFMVPLLFKEGLRIAGWVVPFHLA
jgi:hypothetical protein